MKLYLVRHGRSAGNLPGRMTGWSEHALTDLGTEQARRVSARLAPLGPLPIYASDLPRALDTARLIAARWATPGVASADDTSAEAVSADGAGADGASSPAPREVAGVVIDRRLREIDLGDYEGRPWDELTADQELSAAFAREPLTTRLPGGESLAMVRERVIAAFEEIAGREHAVACLVSHDGPIRTILNYVLRIPPERHWAISTSHGGLSLLETSEDWVSVRFVNDTSHLRGLDVEDGASDAEAPDRADGHSTEDRVGE
jgi:broad specificity phosphatase PhoE